MKKFLLSTMMLAACALGMSADEVTVANGTTTNSYVPFYGSWVDEEETTSQMYYAADSLTEIPVGARITGIKFYTNASGVQFSNAVFKLSMGEMDATPFTGIYGPKATGLTVVATNVPTPAKGTTELVFEFDDPYTYEGGGLCFETFVETGGGYGSTSFIGVNTPTTGDRTSLYAYRTTVMAQRFLPKTTFIFETEARPYDARVTPSELDFGKQAPGASKVLNVSLTNRGANAFTPALSALQAPFSTTYVPAELAGGESVTIPVTFAPDEEGNYTGTLTISCGQAGTFDVTLAGRSALELDMTVADGTTTSNNWPYKGMYTDGVGTLSQMLYPADMVADVQGCQITGLKFYCQAMVDKGEKFEISLGEVEYTTYERETAIAPVSNVATDLTVVATDVTVPANGTEWEIAFDEPYTYNGATLVVQTKVTTAGGYESVNFYGVNVGQDVSYVEFASSSSPQVGQFLPKMTLYYKAPAAQTVTLTGFVNDMENNPLEDVTVTVNITEPNTPAGAPKRAEGDAAGNTYTTTTDANGDYSIELPVIDGATYDVTFSRPGYVDKTMADVDPTMPLNVQLEPDSDTGVEDIDTADVSRVRYIDSMGRVSDKPFSGVNIVVIEHSNGTKTTTKMVK